MVKLNSKKNRSSSLELWSKEELEFKKSGRLTYYLNGEKTTLFNLLLDVQISSASLYGLTKKYKSFTIDNKFKIKSKILDTNCFRFYDVFKDNKKIHTKNTAKEIHEKTKINIKSIYCLACTGNSDSKGHTIIKNIDP